MSFGLSFLEFISWVTERDQCDGHFPRNLKEIKDGIDAKILRENNIFPKVEKK